MSKMRGILAGLAVIFSIGLGAGSLDVYATEVPDDVSEDDVVECMHSDTVIKNEKSAVSYEDGKYEDGYTGDLYCKECGILIANGQVIYAASRVAVSDVTYKGKTVKPAVTVFDSADNIIPSSDYKLVYSNNKKIGTATVEISLTGKYSGSLKGSFRINPKGTGIKKLTPRRRGFGIEWKVQKKEISGYQIQYSLKKDFSAAKIKTIKAGKSASYVKNLKAKKKYYVRIRTYKKVGKESYYSQWSESMSVKTCKYLIVIDPGHQRAQNSGQEPIGPGASTTKLKVAGGTRGVATGIYEYELTLQVAKRLEKVLHKRGYEVVLVRRTHDVNISNSERAKVANKLGADAFVRIHANGGGSASINGAQTICMTSHNPYNASLYKKSYRLSESILNAYVKKTGIRREYVSQVDNMSGINWSKVPVTIIEMGYMTNPEEDRKMASPSFQKKMAQGIANGLDRFFR